jgi:hypothetical protein
MLSSLLMLLFVDAVAPISRPDPHFFLLGELMVLYKPFSAVFIL